MSHNYYSWYMTLLLLLVFHDIVNSYLILILYTGKINCRITLVSLYLIPSHRSGPRTYLYSSTSSHCTN